MKLGKKIKLTYQYYKSLGKKKKPQCSVPQVKYNFDFSV